MSKEGTITIRSRSEVDRSAMIDNRMDHSEILKLNQTVTDMQRLETPERILE